MLNQTPTEAQNSALFLKNYLDYVEELPCDIAKLISRIKELDIKSSNIINETEEITENIISNDGEEKKKLMNRLNDRLIQLQNIKSEKLHYSQIIQEKVESMTRSIQENFQNDISTTINKTEESATIPTVKNINPVVLQQLPIIKNVSKPGSSRSSSASDTNNSGNDKGTKRLRRTTRLDTEVERAETPKSVKVELPATIVKEKNQSTSQQSTSSATNNKKLSVVVPSVAKKKIKKKKAVSSSSSSKQSSTPSVQDPIPIEDENDDEETYCLCGQVSYGEMILCENDACKIEWFHFSCVSLSTKPKGRWYCPNCRGDRPNVLNKNLRKKS